MTDDDGGGKTPHVDHDPLNEGAVGKMPEMSVLSIIFSILMNIMLVYLPK
jgi:hypothetical protein